MAIEFPNSPVEGDQFTASNGVIYTYENGGWNGNSASGLEDVFVNISGDEMSGNLTVPSLNGGQLAGFRNQIINGCLRNWARNTDNNTASTTQLYVSADRWAVKHLDSTGKGLGRVANPYPDAPCSYAGEFRALNNTDVTRIQIEQGIEIEDGLSGPFANGSQWTLSYYGDLAVNFTLYFSDGINDVSAITIANGTTVNVSGNKYSATVTLNGTSAAGKNCLRLTMAPTGTTATTFTATGFQLEPGPVATPFEHRPIGTELALCQRYCFISSLSRPYQIATGNNPEDRWYAQNAPFPVTMRTTPSIEVFSEYGEGIAGLLGINGVNRIGASETIAANISADSVAVRARDTTGDSITAGFYFSIRAYAEL